MLILLSKSGNQLPAHPRVGVLVTPSNGALPDGRPYAADNEAYVGFDRARYLAMLRRLEAYRPPLFVAVPDVVGDHESTKLRWARWSPTIREFWPQYPLAFVCQDGCIPGDIPTDADVLFIGGTTEWKLSFAARAIANDPRWIHVGRVNTARRARLVKSWGVDSIDGTGPTRYPKSELPRLIRATEHEQGSLL